MNIGDSIRSMFNANIKSQETASAGKDSVINECKKSSSSEIRKTPSTEKVTKTETPKVSENENKKLGLLAQFPRITRAFNFISGAKDINKAGLASISNESKELQSAKKEAMSILKNNNTLLVNFYKGIEDSNYNPNSYKTSDLIKNLENLNKEIIITIGPYKSNITKSDFEKQREENLETQRKNCEAAIENLKEANPARLK